MTDSLIMLQVGSKPFFVSRSFSYFLMYVLLTSKIEMAKHGKGLIKREAEAEDDPGIRPDVRRLTAPEIRHLVAYGFEVLSDQEVERIRAEFMATLQPRVEDYMTAAQIRRVVRGEETAPEILVEPAAWNGIGRVQREATLRALEDSFLLGIPLEEMNAQMVHEARMIRAELLTIRTMGREVQRLSRH